MRLKKSVVLLMTVLILSFMFAGCSQDGSKTSTQGVISTSTTPENPNIVDTAGLKDTPSNASSTSSESPTTSINGVMKVHFVDVGQGDATFIELPNEETILIDGGPSKEVVADYIKNLGYNSVTYVIATHPDADHITGLPEVLNNFSVQKFYMPEKEHTTQIFEKMLDSIASNGCEAIYAFAGKSIIDTTNLKVSFVGPTKQYTDNNAASAVIKLVYNGNSFLFTGDADYTSEKDMITEGYNLTADVLKVGHHGSNTSTSEVFLKAVNPKIAVISVGASNSYGHPTQEVLALLNEYKLDIYRTDEVGTVIVECDGVNYTIEQLKSIIQANAPPTPASTPSTVIEENNVKTETSTTNNPAVVYRTKTGSKYHNAGCSYLKSSIETTISEAQSMGLTPCSRCNPPK